MKCWCTMPIPAASASCGLRMRGRPAAHEDLAPVGPVVAVEDAHQGGLAGAVLADDAVDRAGPDRQRLMSWLAWTSPNHLSMPRSSMTGGAVTEPAASAGAFGTIGRSRGPHGGARTRGWSAPDALAVSRLTVSSNRPGSTYGQVGRLGPFEDPVDVDGQLPVDLGATRAVGDQAAEAPRRVGHRRSSASDDVPQAR